MTQAPITLTPPVGTALPIVVDSPHSGTAYPADFGSVLHGPGAAPGRGHLGARALGQRTATAPRCWRPNSRAPTSTPTAACPTSTELLLEPWPEPVAPSRKTELGIGLVWRLMDGQPIYGRRLSVAEVQRRIDRCWRPYHAALQAALGPPPAAPQRWHLNVHSMPDDSLPQAGPADQAAGRLRAGQPRRRHLRRGDDGRWWRTPCAAPATAWRATTRSRAWRSSAPRASRSVAGMHLQIEVKRSLYMDRQLHKNAGFDRLQKAIDGTLAALAAHVRRQLA
jgi:N-formylglutamate deformylase